MWFCTTNKCNRLEETRYDKMRSGVLEQEKMNEIGKLVGIEVRSS